MSVVLGIDPGTRKCGFAVVGALPQEPLELGIVPTAELAATVEGLASRFAIGAVALGGGTNATLVARLVAGCGLPVHLVDERDTTLLARRLYFATHPPRGWRRLIPRGMLLPPRPIDDFAAVLIARRLLASDGTPGAP